MGPTCRAGAGPSGKRPALHGRVDSAPCRPGSRPKIYRWMDPAPPLRNGRFPRTYWRGRTARCAGPLPTVCRSEPQRATTAVPTPGSATWPTSTRRTPSNRGWHARTWFHKPATPRATTRPTGTGRTPSNRRRPGAQDPAAGRPGRWPTSARRGLSGGDRRPMGSHSCAGGGSPSSADAPTDSPAPGTRGSALCPERATGPTGQPVPGADPRTRLSPSGVPAPQTPARAAPTSITAPTRRATAAQRQAASRPAVPARHARTLRTPSAPRSPSAKRGPGVDGRSAPSAPPRRATDAKAGRTRPSPLRGTGTRPRPRASAPAANAHARCSRAVRSCSGPT
jgi:hypothetical protein